MPHKIDYGIDLGTTNSAIARMEGKNAKIIKSDDTQMDTTPSCVFFNKKKTMFVGAIAKQNTEMQAVSAFRLRSSVEINSFIEFKRTMGSDRHYNSSAMNRSFSSEDLSAEVLKKLRSYVRDEVFNSVVISVPAKFKQSMLDATQRASEIAGFKYCELLQEPIAASFAYGIKTNTYSGYWLVFDFGGGTFDAALMKIVEGIMKPVDTEGNTHLGGKDIDMEMVDKLFIPAIANKYDIKEELREPEKKKRLQDALKGYAEKAKIALSSKESWKDYIDELGNDNKNNAIEFEIEISRIQFEETCAHFFQKAIDITKGLLERNNLNGSELDALILVGGPTFSETLRRMLKEQITIRIDSSIDPMTAVAIGAALYASTKDNPFIEKHDVSKAQLILKYPETTVETSENLGIKIDRNNSTIILSHPFSIEVIRADHGWTSGRITMEGDTKIIELLLNKGETNQFDIKLCSEDGSIIPCEPSSIRIIHGMNIQNATLPYSIGLDVYDTVSGNQGVYAFQGLEKNTSLPAIGKGYYKTAKDIHLGNRSDKFTVQFYEFDYGAEGSKAIFNNYFGGTTVNGEQLPRMLPKDSVVELTLRIDTSRRASLSIFIPELDETIDQHFESSTQKAEDLNTLLNDISIAQKLVEKISSSDYAVDLRKYEKELNEIKQLLSNRGNDYDSKLLVRGQLQKIFIALEKVKVEIQWPEIEQMLDNAMAELLVNNQRYGNKKYDVYVVEYQKRTQITKLEKDINAAKQLTDEIFKFSFSLIQQDIGVWMSFFNQFDQNFDMIQWTDTTEAHCILNEAKTMIATNPTKNRIELAVRSLLALQPETPPEPDDDEKDDEKLRKD